MSKASKKRPDNESENPPMQFDDMLRLALKTPPMMAMDLLLNQEQELTDIRGKIIYDGRIITFRQMDVHPQTEKVHQFFIEVRSTLRASKILTPLKLKQKDASTFAAFFKPWKESLDSLPTITVQDGEKIYLTLRKKDDYLSDIELCRLNFTSATKF
jgi:hypothetical protein